MNKKKFDKIATAWEHANKFSSIQRSCPELVAAGEKVIPWLLERLYPNPHWVTTLRAMVDNPPEIPKEVRGKVVDIRNLWVKWAVDNGYLLTSPRGKATR